MACFMLNHGYQHKKFDVIMTLSVVLEEHACGSLDSKGWQPKSVSTRHTDTDTDTLLTKKHGPRKALMTYMYKTDARQN